MDEKSLLRHRLQPCPRGYVLLLSFGGAHQCRPITNLPGDQPAGSHRGPVLLFDAFCHLLPCHSDSPVDGVAYIRIMEKSQYPHQYLRVGWYLRPHVLRH